MLKLFLNYNTYFEVMLLKFEVMSLIFEVISQIFHQLTSNDSIQPIKLKNDQHESQFLT
jgi:hypothetical protein